MLCVLCSTHPPLIILLHNVLQRCSNAFPLDEQYVLIQWEGTTRVTVQNTPHTCSFCVLQHAHNEIGLAIKEFILASSPLSTLTWRLGSTTEKVAGSIRALPKWGGGSKRMPGWLGAPLYLG